MEGAPFGPRPARLLLAALATLLTAASAAAQPSFQGLGDLPGGSSASWAYDVSADGSVVIGASVYLGYDYYRAFRWTAEEGMVAVGAPDPFYGFSYATGVSADGSLITGWFPSFLWTADGGTVYYTDPGWEWLLGCTEAVSADGSVFVGATGDLSGEALRCTSEGERQGLGDLPGGRFYSYAWDVSADGSVVVGWSESGSNYEAFRWTAEEGMVGLGNLGGGNFPSIAVAASADGSVVVGDSASDSGREAFRWTAEEGMVGLGQLPSEVLGSAAQDVSADGSVVVGWSYGSVTGYTPRYGFPEQAFIWDAAHGMRNLQDVLENDYGLDLEGWTLEYAGGISADGRTVVGWGVNPDGDTEAWIAMLPAPTRAVAIDIRPGSETNFVRPAGLGVIPVALLGSEGFDAAEVDEATLAFAPGGAAPVDWIATYQRDVNGDEFADLLSFYRTRETGIAYGDSEACLRGETLAGVPFEGCDAITTVPPCGHGAEAALLLPPLIWLRTRLRRRRE